MDQHHDGNSNVWRGLAAGAIGGAIGSSAMVLFNHLLGSSGFGRDDPGRHDQHRRTDAKPNDTDGTISDEPATEKAASNLHEAATNERLNGPEKRTAGSILHHAFGAMVGAAYGAATARVPQLAAGGGVPYGVLVWAAAAETGLPLVGLAKPPASYRWERHAASLASHLAFGATLEAVRRSMTRR
ncbi:MAG TPA: DUF1440 domain-containing protein [Vicinamibacterales bacterium]